MPTSIGYGAALGGIAPLLASLNTCSPGVTVVNIDNGFGAAVTAARMLRMADHLHKKRSGSQETVVKAAAKAAANGNGHASGNGAGRYSAVMAAVNGNGAYYAAAPVDGTVNDSDSYYVATALNGNGNAASNGNGSGAAPAVAGSHVATYENHVTVDIGGARMSYPRVQMKAAPADDCYAYEMNL